MRHPLSRLLFLFLFWLVVFAVGKLAFVAFCAASPLSVADILAILRHGLPMDAATAAYLLLFPCLAALLLPLLSPLIPPSSKPSRLPSLLLAAYNLLAATLVVAAVVTDIALYPFWGFKLDATILNYLDSPADALASVSPAFVVVHLAVALLAIAILAWCTTRLMPAKVLIPSSSSAEGRPSRLRIKPLLRRALSVILAAAILVVVMRGGITESTMNVGNAYFSDRTFLNHAAVNPLFSFLSSLGKNDHFDRLYRAMPDDEARTIAGSLYPGLATQEPDTLPAIAADSLPSILLIFWEGCGQHLSDVGATPCLDSIAAEGLHFTHLRANSYRTDRGTLSTLSGHPAYPTHSLMKISARAARLPSLARSLRRAGYTTTFTYGGDINFTNMKGYLLSTGFERTVADTDFSLADRRSAKWGVCDSILLDHLYDELLHAAPQPFFHVALTLSSHEPWDVPGHDAEAPVSEQRHHSFAYTDRQIGRLLRRLRQTDLWRRLLVVILPDHGILCDDIDGRENLHFFDIPMVWTGGAAPSCQTIDVLMNQSDLPATLLARLGLPHDDFPWSRDVLSPAYTTPFTYCAFNDGFTVTDSLGTTVYDHLAARVVATTDPASDSLRLRRGLAVRQVSYDAIEALR